MLLSEAVCDFTRMTRKAERKAAHVHATMCTVPLIPMPKGKGERSVVLASLWSVLYGAIQGAKSSGLGCWAGTFLEHSGASPGRWSESIGTLNTSTFPVPLS